MTGNKSSLAEVAALISNNDNFLIVTHEHPDGDALGSVFAMLCFLRQNGKRADAFLPEPLPAKYIDFVPCSHRSEISEFEIREYSYCLVLDNPKVERAGLGGSFSLQSFNLPMINIDHHPDNCNFAEYNLVMPDTAAAAEIVFAIFRELAPSFKISSETASLLMLGMVMDTGGFRFDNTSPHALRSAAELLELGADYSRIIRNMFFSKPLHYIEFEAELLREHLKMDRSGKYAWFFIPEELISKYCIDMRDSEGLIDVLRAIEGTEVVALLQKRDDGIKISLRSKNPLISVGAIARKFNGGGHELAAGGLIRNTDVKTAEDILLLHVERALNEV